LDCSESHQELRLALDGITSIEVAEHESLIDGLRERYSHRIQLVERADPNRRFNRCVPYALGLCDPPAAVLRISQVLLGRVFLSPAFLSYMVETVLQEIDRPSSANDDLVVYAGSGIEHAGLVDGDRVRSKWGEGHVWRHPLLEVPANYGSSIRYFRRVTPEAALSSFYKYARANYGNAVVDRELQNG
jgi:hypothetical protein